MRIFGTSLLATALMVPAFWAHAAPSIIDDTTLVRAYRANSPYNTAPYDKWVDVIGSNIFNTSRLVVEHSNDDVTIKAYTNYQHPYSAGNSAYPTADFAFDLDLNGTFETGFATTSHDSIQAGRLYGVANGWHTSLDLFGINGGVAVAGRHDDCAANPGSCASDDVPVVKIKDGATDLGTFQFTQSASDDPSAGTTYVNTLTLLNVNGNGDWDEFGILWGTAWCANDTIHGVVDRGGPNGDIVLAAPFSLGLTGGGFAMLAAFRRRRRT